MVVAVMYSKTKAVIASKILVVFKVLNSSCFQSSKIPNVSITMKTTDYRYGYPCVQRLTITISAAFMISSATVQLMNATDRSLPSTRRHDINDIYIKRYL
jgi:hypothetical protein